MASQCAQIAVLPYMNESRAKFHLRDIWAIGVITYFLLCGYTPFDRESNLEEMQAILIADYSFTPTEYWRNVTPTARDFINCCLTTDPTVRMTAHQALSHPFVAEPLENSVSTNGTGARDLLPTIKKNFNARRTLHAAIDTVRAINKLREGGAAMGAMEGVVSGELKVTDTAGAGKATGEGGEEMEIDSRGNARGQTEAQIREQERRVQETSRGLWNNGGRGARSNWE